MANKRNKSTLPAHTHTHTFDFAVGRQAAATTKTANTRMSRMSMADAIAYFKSDPQGVCQHVCDYYLSQVALHVEDGPKAARISLRALVSLSRHISLCGAIANGRKQYASAFGGTRDVPTSIDPTEIPDGGKFKPDSDLSAYTLPTWVGIAMENGWQPRAGSAVETEPEPEPEPKAPKAKGRRKAPPKAEDASMSMEARMARMESAIAAIAARL